MRTIVIISARGGSKRLPDKNILKFGDYSLTENAIKFALDIFSNEDIILSTDIKEIEHLKEKYNLIRNGLRPTELSNDLASSLDVLDFEISKLNCKSISKCLLLQPTTPFRRKNDLLALIKLSNKYNNKNIKSVHEEENKEIYYLANNYELKKVFKENDRILKLNGAYYLFTVSNNKVNREHDFLPLLIDDRKFTIDIDYPDQLEAARYYLNENK